MPNVPSLAPFFTKSAHLSDAGVEGARDAAALARLVAEGHLDPVDGERRLGAVRAPVLARVRTVQFPERLL